MKCVKFPVLNHEGGNMTSINSVPGLSLTRDEREDIRIDLAVIANRDARGRNWFFWGGIVAMVCFVLAIRIWPHLHTYLSNFQYYGLFVLIAALGALLGLLLGRWDGGAANRMRQSYMSDLLHGINSDVGRRLKAYTQSDEDESRRKIAQGLLDEAKSLWNNVGVRIG